MLDLSEPENSVLSVAIVGIQQAGSHFARAPEDRARGAQMQYPAAAGNLNANAISIHFDGENITRPNLKSKRHRPCIPLVAVQPIRKNASTQRAHARQDD